MMARGLYTKYKESFLAGTSPDLADVDVRVILIDENEYTVDLNTDEFLDDVPAEAILATSGNLSNKTITNGIFDADNITITSVPNTEFQAILIYHHTGTDETSRLLYYDNEDDDLPAQTSGGEVTIQWDSGANRIFAL